MKYHDSIPKSCETHRFTDGQAVWYRSGTRADSTTLELCRRHTFASKRHLCKLLYIQLAVFFCVL